MIDNLILVDTGSCELVGFVENVDGDRFGVGHTITEYKSRYTWEKYSSRVTRTPWTSPLRQVTTMVGRPKP